MRGLRRDRAVEPLSPIFPATTTTPFLSKRKDLKVFSLCLFYCVPTILSESLAQAIAGPLCLFWQPAIYQDTTPWQFEINRKKREIRQNNKEGTFSCRANTRNTEQAIGPISGGQSEHRIPFILPACGLSHTINNCAVIDIIIFFVYHLSFILHHSQDACLNVIINHTPSKIYWTEII